MDKLTPSQRSINMSKIFSKNTKPELLIRKMLWSRGVRYRCNVRAIKGTPDVANKHLKMALDVHGCFWHGHKNCKLFRLPKSKKQFWKQKIQKNIERDETTKNTLKMQGYQYFVIWECQIKEGNFGVIDEFVEVYFRRRNIDQ